ncbi:serine hydrolase domain-containing protein [Arthrobacter alpinus]|uniref:serine hydrolase domain-containing protein n=1 Tax=Arthrobacter alpinus TaxID=656366 RepID=UPI0005C932AA|nr:serine hydrolase domain-containing protein [Arthrobacter alpinus]
MDFHNRAQARLSEGRAPATALAAFSGGARIGQSLAGIVDGRGSVPETTTAFRIASCTKSFTAAAILLLRDRGQLSLDDDAREYLSTLKIMGCMNGPENPVMTLHMLLSMCSGLPTDDPWADRQESMSHGDFEDLMSHGVRLVRSPGSAYEYSNLGYAMLGKVVERVSGVGYRRFIEREFLEPLKLNGTAFSKETMLAQMADRTSSATTIATGYRKNTRGNTAPIPDQQPYNWEELPTTGPGAFSAIGGLFSTLDDMGRWAAWLQEAFHDEHATGSTVASAGPLCRETRREMQDMHQVSEPADVDGTVNGYGYGLVVQHHGLYGTVIGHSGGYPGFSAHMRWHPGTGNIVVGFENATYSKVGVAVRALLEERLARKMVGAGAASQRAVQRQEVLELTASAVAVPEPIVSWPETIQAMAAVEELVRSPGSTLGNEVFSPNVVQDMPWEERRAAMEAALAVVGPLADSADERTPPRWETAASVEWDLPARGGDLRIRVKMTPVDPPRVQLLEISPRT